MAKKVKIIAIIVALIVSNMVSYWFGSHTVFLAKDVYEDGSMSISYPHWFNTQRALDYERSYACALMEGLHRFYSNDDNDFWFDVFMETPEYQKIDSINGGDWEDFYYYSTPIMDYGTE